jgi:hypothetical protein
VGVALELLIVNDRHLFWKKLDSNPLWLQGMMSRYKQPSSFAMAMAPERTARISDPEWRAIADWIEETKFPVVTLPGGILAFETAEDMTMFLLRWSK